MFGGKGNVSSPLCEVIGSAKSYIIFGWFVLAGSFKVIQVVRLFISNWYLPVIPANHYVTTTGDAPNASQLLCVSPRGSKIYQVLREPALSLHPSSLLTQMAEDQKDDKPIFMEGPWGEGMGTILHRICGESSVTIYSWLSHDKEQFFHPRRNCWCLIVGFRACHIGMDHRQLDL
jgi:hypothetical protein